MYRSLVSLRFSTAVDLITDALIIALPLYLALRVQLPLIEKLALAGIFSLGGVIMLFAIIRIAVTDQHNSHPETSWLNLWSQIEASVAVIISSLAPFKALFARGKTTSYHFSGSDSHGGRSNNRRSRGPLNSTGSRSGNLLRSVDRDLPHEVGGGGVGDGHRHSLGANGFARGGSRPGVKRDMAIPLDERAPVYAEQGTISFASRADPRDRAIADNLPAPHIVKTLEIEQHAYNAR